MKKRSRPMAIPEPTPSWLYILVTILCVCFLAVGFFFAARQHFMAMDLGIKNSKLRKQIDEMEGEQRRLVLAREVVRSPLEIKRIAARRGLRNADEVFAPVQTSLKQTAKNDLVQKTVMSSPVKADAKPVKAFFAPGTSAPKKNNTVSKTLIAKAN